MLSHTGSLAGEERVVDAALRQCGILRASSIEDAWDLAAALCRGVAPVGGQVAVISDGGGHSSVLCDALGLAGLSVPRFSESTRIAFEAFLPRRASLENPVDFAGVVETEPEILPRATEICLKAPEVDAVIIAGHFGGYHKIGGQALEAREVEAARGVAAQDRHGRPLIMHSIYANERLAAHEVLRESGIPVLRAPESAARLLSGLQQAGMAGKRRTADAKRLSTPNRSALEDLITQAVGV